MRRSPENFSQRFESQPEDVSSQEEKGEIFEKEPEKVENLIEGLRFQSFVSQVIERKVLKEYKESLENDDLEKAIDLLKGTCFPREDLGYQIYELRIREVFNFGPFKELENNSRWQKELENAENLQTEILKSWEGILDKRKRGEEISKDELVSFGNQVEEFYNYLEKMLPGHFRKAYLERELERIEKWLKEHPEDSPQKEGINQRKELLIKAKERLEKDSTVAEEE